MVVGTDLDAGQAQRRLVVAFSRTAYALVGVTVFGGCSGDTRPPSVSADEYAAAHSEWRQDRRDRLVTPPGGAVLWMGLWELPQGAVALGSDPSLPIVLPAEDAPPQSGLLHRDGEEVRLEPATGDVFRIHEGEAVSGPTALAHDRTEEPTRLSLGSLGLRIHSEAGTDRLWLRVWDEDSPLRETFQLPDEFPLEPAWRIAARFEPFDEPRTLAVRDVTSGSIEYQVPGELVFEREGAEHRLLAIAGESSTSFFVMLWDETARSETYQAGRYMRVPFADEDGWTTIDFNRAYNAPCAFTEHSVCGLPPPQNHLAFAVTAGEMRPSDH